MSKSATDEWGEVYRALVSARPDSTPDDERLADLVVGDLDDDQRQAAFEAALQSTDGAARLRDLIDLHAAAAAVAESDPRWTPSAVSTPAAIQDKPGGRAARRHLPVALAAAAMLTLAIGLLGWQILQGSPEATGPAVERSVETARIAAQLAYEEPLSREAFVLEWSLQHADIPAVGFDLLVSTAERTLAEIRGLEIPSYRLDDELEGVPAGTPVFYAVEAMFGDGSRLRSETFVVVLID